MISKKNSINAWGRSKYILDFMLFAYSFILIYLICPPFADEIDGLYKAIRRFI